MYKMQSPINGPRQSGIFIALCNGPTRALYTTLHFQNHLDLCVPFNFDSCNLSKITCGALVVSLFNSKKPCNQTKRIPILNAQVLHMVVHVVIRTGSGVANT